MQIVSICLMPRATERGQTASTATAQIERFINLRLIRLHAPRKQENRHTCKFVVPVSHCVHVICRFCATRCCRSLSYASPTSTTPYCVPESCAAIRHPSLSLGSFWYRDPKSQNLSASMLSDGEEAQYAIQAQKCRSVGMALVILVVPLGIKVVCSIGQCPDGSLRVTLRVLLLDAVTHSST